MRRKGGTEQWTDPRARLELFLERVANLRNRRAVRAGLPTGLSFSWSQGGPASFTVREPDEDDLLATLTSFRPFVLKDDPSHLSSVLKFCKRNLTDATLKGYAVAARERWLFALRNGGFRVEQNGCVLPPEVILDLWLNGHHFHPDLDKRRALGELGPLTPAARFAFLAVVTSGIELADYAGWLVAEGLRAGHFRFQ